jgi:acyl carrier protein
MDQAEILARMEPVMRDLFDEYEGPITAELNADAVGQWDSLANVQLMVLVEQTFRIRFKNEEIATLRNLGDLADLIAGKLG